MAKKKGKSKPKQPVKSAKPSIPENVSTEVIAAAYSSVVQPVFLKVCRLCESKDGPFLNIFDADKVTAKKIDELMPFGIAENDDLPHKICFRCSAKLEELYEFIQKCIRTQESLRTAIGKTGPFIMKTKTRSVWEEKLNKTNMSNDDICDALIKKAMEGIKDIPLKPLPVPEETPQPLKRVTRRSDAPASTTTTAALPSPAAAQPQPPPPPAPIQPPPSKRESTSDENDDMEINLKQVKLTLEKYDSRRSSNRSTKSNNADATKSSTSGSNTVSRNVKNTNENKTKNTVNNFSFDYVEESETDVKKNEEKQKAEKPFNIMDYVSMIKVNGVGVLFQCKLCNRNFCKKEVVESHNCAKNGVPKVEIPKSMPAPEPPKAPTVKYIKIDGDMKKSLSWKTYQHENDKTSITDGKKLDDGEVSKEIVSKNEECTIKPAPKPKSKPKVGPASKTRRGTNETDLTSPKKDSDSQESQSSTSQAPSVQFPCLPNLNSRYKLVPGPNNMFTLVEESNPVSNEVPVKDNQKSSKKRKIDEVVNTVETKSKDRKKDVREKSKSPEVIDLEEQQKPYPVGLFQTVGHSARLYEPPMPTPPTPFTTPAMKKQSYTIVQTGNPSKLLISTKAQAPPAELPKKRQRKSKHEEKVEDDSKEPFRVTLEDVAPPKDTGFFTFINVDPLLQPSYVLPTDNIIQESQISTSTSAVRNAPENSKDNKDKEKYSCNMCGENFSREKKLLAHIQSHYTKMDEEDQIRAEKGSKKKGKK